MIFWQVSLCTHYSVQWFYVRAQAFLILEEVTAIYLGDSTEAAKDVIQACTEREIDMACLSVQRCSWIRTLACRDLQNATKISQDETKEVTEALLLACKDTDATVRAAAIECAAALNSRKDVRVKTAMMMWVFAYSSRKHACACWCHSVYAKPLWDPTKRKESSRLWRSESVHIKSLQSYVCTVTCQSAPAFRSASLPWHRQNDDMWCACDVLSTRNEREDNVSTRLQRCDFTYSLVYDPFQCL